MIGTQIGRYRIDSELGRGGMGVVYRGTQVTLDRTVAIKMLPAHLADGDNRERFRREALTLARLAHPNIIHIYDVEDQDGHSFIMMEHVGGGSLGDQMSPGTTFSAARCVEIFSPILSALHAAHLAGIVHRDIKPDNILFTASGRPKLTDFGVAHMRDAGSKTRTGVMLGTPYYMSPEQAQGRRVTAAADLYAVGVVLYEMLSGGVPFTGEDPLSVALKHVQEPPRPLAELRPDLPAELCALVHRALEKDPTARFHSAAAMQDALESGSWAPGRTTLDPDSSGARVAVPILPEVPAPETPEPPAAVSGAHDAPSTSVGAATAAGPPSLPPQPAPASSSGTGDAVPSAPSGAGWATGMGDTGRRMGAWLARPAWRGLPMAFWAGAAALALALVWIGADALAGPNPASGDSSEETEAVPPVQDGAQASRETPRVPVAGPSSGGSTGRTSSPADPRTRPELSDEEREALRTLARGGETQANPADDLISDTARTQTIIDRIDAVADDDGPVTLDDLRDRDPDPEPDPDPTPTSRELVQSLVERQIRAVETANRALFLQDFHPDVRDAAAEEFDGAAGVTNVRSTISNLNIEFLEPDYAVVTFDVDVSYTIRSNGQSGRESYAEEWDVRREGNRWWIVAWK